MSKRRKSSKQDDSSAGVVVLLFLAAGYLLTAFENNPFLVSLIEGLLFTFIFWAIWTLVYRRRKKRAFWAASNQLYQEMSDQDFEYAVAELFRFQGYKATVTNRSNDRGIDIYLEKNGRKVVAQCKQYKENIGPAYIREFIGAIQGARVDEGFFITTSDFSKMAREAVLNSEYRIHLINGRILGEWQLAAHNLAQGKSLRTAFIPASWWLQLKRRQKGVIFGLLLAVTFVAGTAAAYIAGTLMAPVLRASIFF